MEVLAKTVLDAPVEIQVGGRSVVNADITQVRPRAHSKSAPGRLRVQGCGVCMCLDA